MADGLKLSQLAGIFAGMAQGPATFNPAQRVFTDYLQGSAQSAIQAEAQRKAEKKAKKKSSGIGSLLGGAAAVAAAPFTGGASLAYVPTAMAAGGAVDSMVAGDAGGVISNTANAVGGGLSTSEARSAPMNVPRISMDDNPAAMLGDMSQKSTPSLAQSVGPAKPETGKSDVWENGGGSAMARQATTQFVGMKPSEIRKTLNTSPGAEQALIQYLNAGGQLSKKQMRGIPASVKNNLRTYGYQMPGPFGIRMY
jgi:hypothetical protein